jgi:hypothetical protein
VLDAFIIDQIRKRDQQHRDDRPVLELPLPSEQQPDRKPEQAPADEDEGGQRGVIIIDFA